MEEVTIKATAKADFILKDYNMETNNKAKIDIRRKIKIGKKKRRTYTGVAGEKTFGIKTGSYKMGSR
ncbi:MAG: hypothetical protein K1W19_05595 [Lachnospiraceae bacterium]